MHHPPRRRFICQLLAAGGLGAASFARAQAVPPRVDEDSEQARALGYRHDTTKVDEGKYPQHAVRQRCDNCSFYQGRAGDPWGGCAMFGRKQVAGPGWCVAWAKVPA